MSVRPLRLLLVAVLLLLALTPAAGQAHLRGNPFTRGPVYNDLPGREDAHIAFAGWSVPAGTTRALFASLARVPTSKWWPMAGPGKTRVKMRWFLKTADRRRSFRGHSTRFLLRGAPKRARRARPFVVLTDENQPKADCATNRVQSPGPFRRWVKAYARGIGRHRAILFVGADGTGRASCMRGAAKRLKMGLLSFEVRTLSRLPNTAVYVDAASAEWLRAGQAASLLRHEGIRYARGFAVNLTHYDWTGREVRYGQGISRRLGGKPFVVNTALNGNGPLVVAGHNVWCNPAGRSLGPLPRVHPARHVDAFFWIGRPGHSDGTCGEQAGSMPGPAASSWWAQWAIQLVRDARRARDFPAWRR